MGTDKQRAHERFPKALEVDNYIIKWTKYRQSVTCTVYKEIHSWHNTVKMFSSNESSGMQCHRSSRARSCCTEGGKVDERFCYID